jgi:hypothetical protein
LVQEARESGLNISLDQYPYTASSTGISILLPARLSEGGLKAARLKLSDPVTRKQIRSEMLHQLEENGWKDYSFAKIAYCEFDHSLVGLTIPEISQCPREALPKGNRSMDTLSRFDFKNAPKQTNTESELERQADIVIDLFSHGGAQMVYFEMAEADVETIMKTPEIMFGSDSGVRQENALVLPHRPVRRLHPQQRPLREDIVRTIIQGLDGTKVGDTPLNAAPVPLGTHDVLVKRASGGDEFSSFNSRRRRSLRVTDSPRLRE